MAVKTDNSRERGEFWNYKGEHKKKGKEIVMKGMGSEDEYPDICVEEVIVKQNTAG